MQRHARAQGKHPNCLLWGEGTPETLFLHTVHGSVARGDASEMPPLLATGEAAALALAAVYKRVRVRVRVRVASLLRTCAWFVQQNQELFCLLFF